MEKIDFKDLPNTTTPLSSENLNKLQGNIETAIEDVIKELFGTAEEVIDANEIVDVGIYKISGVIENFHKSTVYNQFIMYVNWDGYKLIQTIIGEGCIYYRTAEEFRGSFSWSNWELQSSGGTGGGDTLPIGTILPFGSDTVPNNYLLADGSLVSRTTYSELFAVIGTTYGEGDGSTTFALPNLCGKVAVGKDTSDTDFNALGKTGGEKTHTLTKAELPKIDIQTNFASASGGDGSGLVYGTKTGSSNNSLIENINYGGEPHKNLQPYLVTNYIIKAKMIVAVEGEIIQEAGTASTTNVYSAVAVDNKLKVNIVTGQESATNEYIDEKQVFVKAINFGNLPNNATKTVETGLDIANISIVRIDGIAYRSAGPAYLALPNNGIEIWTSDNSIAINCVSDRSTFNAHVRIYYTKNEEV